MESHRLPDPLRTVLSGLVHEMNNLLTPVALQGDLLLDRQADPDDRRRLETILQRFRQIQWALESLRFLYTDDRWEAYSPPLPFARALQQLLAYPSRRLGISVEWCIEEGLPPLAKGAFDRRLAILYELLELLERTPGGSCLGFFIVADPSGGCPRLLVFASEKAHPAAAAEGPRPLSGSEREALLARVGEGPPLLALDL